MKILLEKINSDQCSLDLIADWRNQSLITLRNSDLTAKGQSQINWVNNMSEGDKYYFIYHIEPKPGGHNNLEPFNILAGYCGLDKIHPVNRTAEISLLIGTKFQNSGLGSLAVEELLRMGFEQFNLNCVFGECYKTTDVWQFWRKQGFTAEGVLKTRKYWKNRFYDSVSFSMTKQQWMEINR